MVKANLLTHNLTKKEHQHHQLLKLIDNHHNHLFIINFYAPPSEKFNALIELAEEVRHIDSQFSHYQLIIAGDFNCPPNKSEIKKICLQGGLTTTSNKENTRGNNILDYFISKNIKILGTSTGYKIGMSDHKYITLSFKTIGHLKRRIISAFPKAALIKKLNETDLQEFRHINGYLSLSSYLSKEIKPKAIKHKSFITFETAKDPDPEKRITGSEALKANGKILWNF